jgi:hypothetical protein
MLRQNHKSLDLNEFTGVKSSEESQTENTEMFLSMITLLRLYKAHFMTAQIPIS